jgi:glycosyltransferase involved in cell wall biosynthesis
MKKASVIMASFLGDYPNAASNRDKKLIRAVNSFINQSYENKELVIVSDGCTKTYEI